MRENLFKHLWTSHVSPRFWLWRITFHSILYVNLSKFYSTYNWFLSEDIVKDNVLYVTQKSGDDKTLPVFFVVVQRTDMFFQNHWFVSIWWTLWMCNHLLPFCVFALLHLKIRNQICDFPKVKSRSSLAFLPDYTLSSCPFFLFCFVLGLIWKILQFMQSWEMPEIYLKLVSLRAQHNHPEGIWYIEASFLHFEIWKQDTMRQIFVNDQMLWKCTWCLGGFHGQNNRYNLQQKILKVDPLLQENK